MAVCRFFETGEMEENLNHTNMCLIPKFYPQIKFKPIALCNVAYKIISKILVNRMKEHLKCIIYENQTAFVPERIISDNFLVAHEIFHRLKVRRRQATSYMAVKIDITKAYDRLEWYLIEETMRQMGF